MFKLFTFITPGHWLARKQCYALSPLPGEHSSNTRLKLLSILHVHWLSHPTGYPFNPWVESGKCRSISCQRTRTADLVTYPLDHDTSYDIVFTLTLTITSNQILLRSLTGPWYKYCYIPLQIPLYSLCTLSENSVN